MHSEASLRYSCCKSSGTFRVFIISLTASLSPPTEPLTANQTDCGILVDHTSPILAASHLDVGLDFSPG